MLWRDCQDSFAQPSNTNHSFSDIIVILWQNWPYFANASKGYFPGASLNWRQLKFMLLKRQLKYKWLKVIVTRHAGSNTERKQWKEKRHYCWTAYETWSLRLRILHIYIHKSSIWAQNRQARFDTTSGLIVTLSSQKPKINKRRKQNNRKITCTIL